MPNSSCTAVPCTQCLCFILTDLLLYCLARARSGCTCHAERQRLPSPAVHQLVAAGHHSRPAYQIKALYIATYSGLRSTLACRVIAMGLQTKGMACVSITSNITPMVRHFASCTRASLAGSSLGICATNLPIVET